MVLDSNPEAQARRNAIPGLHFWLKEPSVPSPKAVKKQILLLFRKYRPILILVLKYGLGIGVLTWLIWSHWHIEGKNGQEEGLVGVFDRPFQVHFLLLAAGLCLASVLLTFVRWYFLVRAQELPFEVSSAVRLGFMGFFMNTFLPGSVGGDIVKAAFLAREQSRRTVAVATVLVDRMVGLCGLIWLTALLGGILWFTGQLPILAPTETALTFLESVVWGTAFLTAASLTGWLLMGVLPVRWVARIGDWLGRCPKIGHMLRELWNAVWLYRRKTRHVALALGLSMCGHLGFFTTFYCAARTVNPPDQVPSLRAHLLFVPVGNTLQSIVPTPGGMGGGEIGFGVLYETMGSNPTNGVWASLVQRSIMWVLGFMGYLVYLRMNRRDTALPSPEPGAC